MQQYLKLLVVPAGALVVAIVLARRWQHSKHGLPLPPGPKGLPILGNVLQIPSEKPWRVFNDWRKTYGDMIYLEVPGQRLLVLNSLEDCLALMEKRALNYSDRTQTMVSKMMDLKIWNWGFNNYGSLLKEYRRIFHSLLSPQQIPQYQPVIEEEVHLFLQRLLATPANFADHVRVYFGSVIIRIAYGISDPEYTAARIAEVENLIATGGALLRPGRFLVDFIPLLRFVPSWFPGAWWKREIARVRALAYRVANVPYDEAKERLEGGKGTDGYPSMMQQLLAGIDPDASEERRRKLDDMGRYTTVLAFAGGGDTSIATGLGLFAALGAHPEVQEKAYAQISEVVGHERLPQLSDLDQLPYIRAILKELARWHVITPLSIPHQSRDDDEYNGYFIPAGTLILPNAWAILNDPKKFANPDDFNPDRYLDQDGNIDPNVLDSEMAAFGFGRRICPGRHLSIETTRLMIACLLAVFEVKPPKDEFGNPVPIEMDTAPDLVAKPLPFQCEVVPRSKKLTAALIS